MNFIPIITRLEPLIREFYSYDYKTRAVNFCVLEVLQSPQTHSNTHTFQLYKHYYHVDFLVISICLFDYIHVFQITKCFSNLYLNSCSCCITTTTGLIFLFPTHFLLNVWLLKITLDQEINFNIFNFQIFQFVFFYFQLYYTRVKGGGASLTGPQQIKKSKKAL